MRKKGMIYTALTLVLTLLLSTLITMGYGNNEEIGESVVALENNVESLVENELAFGEGENLGNEYVPAPENLEEVISEEYNTGGFGNLELFELNEGNFGVMPLFEEISPFEDDDDDYGYLLGVRARASGITMPSQVTNGMGEDLGIVFIINRDGAEVWRRPMVWQDVGEGGTFIFSPKRQVEGQDETWELESDVPPSEAGTFTWSILVGTNNYQLTGPTSGPISFTHVTDYTCQETGYVWHQYFWEHTFQFTRATGNTGNTENTGDNTAAPQTGDNASVMLYVLLAIASLSVLLGIPYHKRNRYSPSLSQEFAKLK